MAIFLLVRHAENDFIKKGRLAGRLPGIHLNEAGRKQALATAENLAEAPVKAIYSSPLERAVETAETIAKSRNLEVITDSGLIEIDVGEWQGESVKRLSRLKIWKTVQGSPSCFRFPGGESFAEAQRRICQELEGLAGRYEEHDLVVCVSHADPIKLAVSYFVGLPLDLFQRLSVAPASITTLMICQTGSRLLALNFNPSFTFPKA